MPRSRKKPTEDEEDKDKKKRRRVTFKDVADTVDKNLDKAAQKRGKKDKSNKSGKGKSSKKSKGKGKPKAQLRRQNKRLGKNLEAKSNKKGKGKNNKDKEEKEEEEVVSVPKPKLATPSTLLPETDGDHTRLLIAMFFNKLQNNPAAYGALGQLGQILRKCRVDPTEVLAENEISPEVMDKLKYEIADKRVWFFFLFVYLFICLFVYF